MAAFSRSCSSLRCLAPSANRLRFSLAAAACCRRLALSCGWFSEISRRKSFINSREMSHGKAVDQSEINHSEAKQSKWVRTKALKVLSSGSIEASLKGNKACRPVVCHADRKMQLSAYRKTRGVSGLCYCMRNGAPLLVGRWTMPLSSRGAPPQVTYSSATAALPGSELPAWLPPAWQPPSALPAVPQLIAPPPCAWSFAPLVNADPHGQMLPIQRLGTPGNARGRGPGRYSSSIEWDTACAIRGFVADLELSGSELLDRLRQSLTQCSSS